MNGTRSRVRALAARSEKVPGQLRGQQKRAAIEDQEFQESNQAIDTVEKPPQKLVSLYETPNLTFASVRQPSRGKFLLNWLESVEPYHSRRCQSETNIQVLPDFYTQAPPVLDLQSDVMTLSQEQNSMAHSYESFPVIGPTTGLNTREVVEKRAVERREYRAVLSANGINLLRAEGEIPDRIKAQVNAILESTESSATTESTFVSCSDVWTNIAIGGANEAKVRRFFEIYLFNETNFPADICSNETVMKKADIPILQTSTAGEYVSAPNPDLALGYTVENTLRYHACEVNGWDQNTAKFCFLSVNYKGDGSISSGRLWVATNQCLIATATCVNIIRRLRRAKLLETTVTNELDQFVFGIIANGTEARLYVTYADDDETTNMKLIRGFLLYDKNHRMELERCVRNIFKWAVKRLVHIKAVLDAIRAENSHRATHTAESSRGRSASKRQRKTGG